MGEDRALVVVANRLPVRLVDGEWSVSPGGLVAALAPALRRQRGTWIGWTGDLDDEAAPFEHDGLRLRSVAMSETELAEHYEGASNATLWPLYHDAIQTPEFHRHWWRTHLDVNRRFAEAVADEAPPDALVWVHDYQLQLVPSYLRQLRPDLRIGFFLHIPFPPVEIFARLPWRRQVARSLLDADVVGFQTVPDARNFVDVAQRLLGLSARQAQVSVDGRTVKVASYPISVDTGAIETAARRPGREQEVQEMRERLGRPRRLFLGVDRLDYTKGIEVRLRAFQELLERGVCEVPDAVMVQVAVPSREDVLGYPELRSRIEQLIGEINGEFGQVGAPAVHYLHRGLPFDDLVTLYRTADVLLVTPLRDGMNLVAKEFVAANVDSHGTLVLSEFAGAFHELRAATIVNPYDTDGVREAIAEALDAPEEQRRQTMAALRRVVRRRDVHRWADRFLSDLAAA